MAGQHYWCCAKTAAALFIYLPFSATVWSVGHQLLLLLLLDCSLCLSCYLISNICLLFPLSLIILLLLIVLLLCSRLETCCSLILWKCQPAGDATAVHCNSIPVFSSFWSFCFIGLLLPERTNLLFCLLCHCKQASPSAMLWCLFGN